MNAEYVSPDGRLRFRVKVDNDGDVTLGFVGFPWHTHADILATFTALPQDEAVRRFVNDLLSSNLVIALWSDDGELRDVWVSDDPESDAQYPQEGESIELRYWDGRVWSPSQDEHGGS